MDTVIARRERRFGDAPTSCAEATDAAATERGQDFLALYDVLRAGSHMRYSDVVLTAAVKYALAAE